MSNKEGPVIVITGTPGTGKSTLAEAIIRKSPVPFKHVNVSLLVKENGLHVGYDEEAQTYDVDEERVGAQKVTSTILL